MKNKTKKQFIRIEPRKSYDKAIVRKLKSGKLIYSFDKLVLITMKEYDMSVEDSIEWVDYNILGLSANDAFGVY